MIWRYFGTNHVICIPAYQQDLWQRIKETDFDIFFSTCFWPTTTCLFFLPSMVAGIRHMTGDQKWLQLSSQLRCLTGFRVGIRGVPTDPHTPEIPRISSSVSRTLNSNEVSTVQKLLLLPFQNVINLQILIVVLVRLPPGKQTTQRVTTGGTQARQAQSLLTAWNGTRHLSVLITYQRCQRCQTATSWPSHWKPTGSLTKETFKLGPSNDS